MRRVWTIRARTAFVFAVTAMALAVAVVVFANLMTSWSLQRQLTEAESVQLTLEHAAGSVPADREEARATSGTSRPANAGAAVLVVAAAQWQWSVIGILGAGVVAGALGWAVSRRMLQPIDRITAIANRISASSLHERIRLAGPDDELRRLSRTVDDLLDRLETAFDSQRRFVAQASHELRTPLAVQRAALQIALPDSAAPHEIAAARSELLEQNRRTEHLVESLLVLAEAERGLDGRVEPVDVEAVVHDVIGALAAEARRARVAVRCVRRGRGAVVRAEPVLTRQLVVNLVDNALEYNVVDGFVAVEVAEDAVTIENSGPVVPADAVDALVEPFRRSGAGTRRHSGLGLSIVAAIVRAHGWTDEISARPEGGLRVRVEFGPDRA